MKAQILIVSFLAFCDATAWAQRTSPELAADYESMTLVGTLRGTEQKNFEITINCIPLSRAHRAAHSMPPAKLLGLATDGYKTRCVVETLSLRLNGDAINLPDKSHYDLADLMLPTGVYVTSRGQSFVLHIKGGDGVTAYEARLIVEGQRLVARELDQIDQDGELKTTVTMF
jgi:hypothetical protein